MTTDAARCPRCAAELRAGQDWCLECGAAARTRLAPTPRWRAPVTGVIAVAALCGIALAFAFARLSNTNDEVRATKAATGVPVPAQPAATATTPAPSPFTTTTGPTAP